MGLTGREREEDLGKGAAFQYLRGLVSPDPLHYLVGNVINSEHYLLKLVFTLCAFRVNSL